MRTFAAILTINLVEHFDVEISNLGKVALVLLLAVCTLQDFKELYK